MKNQLSDGQSLLSRSECNVMRGLAILAIISLNSAAL